MPYEMATLVYLFVRYAYLKSTLIWEKYFHIYFDITFICLVLAFLVIWHMSVANNQ